MVNIGGGIQGLETAWSLHRAGKKVAIVEVAPRLMAKQLDEKTSEILKNKLEEAGVDIHLQASAGEIIGNDEVTGIVSVAKPFPVKVSSIQLELFRI